MPNNMVIDISHWQTIPKDLRATRAAGVLGLIHKATEGNGGRDEKYGSRRYLAGDAGMLFGAYHFLRPGDMKKQADIFLDYAEPDAAMLLAADHEDNRVSLADLQSWCEFVAERAGRLPVIYSGHVLKEQLGGKRHAVLNGDNYRLWLAQYASSPTLPVGWASYWLWQWTDQGKVPGINPPTDLDDYQGTEGALRATWAGNGEVQPPTPPPPPADWDVWLSPVGFQAALAEAGFYDGELDGLSGPMTREAVDVWFADGDPLPIRT